MPDPFAALRHELAVANRILANEGIIDAFGHISARSPEDPSRYFISRHRAAELVEPSDVLEMTLDSRPVAATGHPRWREWRRRCGSRRRASTRYCFAFASAASSAERSSGNSSGSILTSMPRRGWSK